MNRFLQSLFRYRLAASLVPGFLLGGCGAVETARYTADPAGLMLSFVLSWAGSALFIWYALKRFAARTSRKPTHPQVVEQKTPESSA